jgi:hypothetical protein
MGYECDSVLECLPTRWETLGEKQQQQQKKRAKTLATNQALVAHVCDLCYLVSWDWEDRASRPAQANSSQDPHLQNNQSKMDWLKR